MTGGIYWSSTIARPYVVKYYVRFLYHIEAINWNSNNCSIWHCLNLLSKSTLHVQLQKIKWQSYTIPSIPSNPSTSTMYPAGTRAYSWFWRLSVVISFPSTLTTSRPSIGCLLNNSFGSKFCDIVSMAKTHKKIRKVLLKGLFIFISCGELQGRILYWKKAKWKLYAEYNQNIIMLHLAFGRITRNGEQIPICHWQNMSRHFYAISNRHDIPGHLSG